MRAAEEIISTARDESPFSNGTEWEIWSAHWCFAPCRNPVEVAWQRYEEGKRKTQLKGYEGGCPLIMCAMLGKTPTEWLEQPDDSPDKFHCIEFVPPDEGGGRRDPRPPGPPRAKREPPNMDGLFPRPERRTRMLKDLSVSREMVPA